MHGLLTKTLIIATLWSAGGLALTAFDLSRVPGPQTSLDCVASTSPSAPSDTCQSYAEAVTAALAAG